MHSTKENRLAGNSLKWVEICYRLKEDMIYDSYFYYEYNGDLLEAKW